MNKTCTIVLLLFLTVTVRTGVAGESGEEQWNRIPFLNCTSTVQQLNEVLNNTSLKPSERFTALASLFTSYVPVDVPLSFLTNILVSPDWIDHADIIGTFDEKVRAMSPNAIIVTFTNEIPDRKDIIPGNASFWEKPKLTLEPSVDPRSRQEAISFLKGHSSVKLKRFIITMRFENSSLVFTRTKEMEFLRFYGNSSLPGFNREPNIKKVQPNAAPLPRDPQPGHEDGER